MTTSADVIAALNQRRQRKSLRPEVPGQLPSGWQGWLDALPVLDAHAPGAIAPAWVDAFLQRPLRAVPRTPALLGRWPAFRRLLQQEWMPNGREDRGLRIGVSLADVILHVILAALLLWLMYLRFMALAQQQPDDEAVQVEFIGRGNIAEGGGALANAGAESAPAAAAPASRNPAPSPAQPAAIASVATPPQPRLAASPEVPQREPAPPVPLEASQPLQVSEVPTPQPHSFRLPPPKERAVQLPQAQLREVQRDQRVEDIPALTPQPVRTLQPRQAQAQLQVPELRNQPQELDVPAPQRMQAITARVAPATASQQAQVQVPELRGQVQDIPMPPGGAPAPSTQAGNGTSPTATAKAPGAGGERGTAPAAGQAPAGSGQGVKPAEQGGRGVAKTGAGAGPGLKPAPGGWPGAEKSDDWGASKRNVAGTGNGNGREGNGKPGLFNDDGSVRLPDEWTRQSGIDVDRAGTWLKRPGLEYRGTRFDKYWIPQGTLLEEWVRRGIKKVAIPIPGTSIRLQCVVSVLQLGGGCLPMSDDVNEQPAVARPPPDIPFKPELQEDNGSIRPQDGG